MKKLSILLLAFFMLLIVGCKNEQPTLYSLPDKYTIQNDTNWVVVMDTMSIDIRCLSFDKLNNNYVIDDSISYNQLLQTRWEYWDCPNYQLPLIDFTQYTLIGYMTKTGPCEIKRTVYKNDSQRKYYYLINITITSWDKILVVNDNWLLVPKINPGYTFVFDTIMTYNIK